MSKKVRIFHNPRCSKCRQTMDILDDKDVDATVIEYLKTPPNKTELDEILELLGIEPRELMRKQEALLVSNNPDGGRLIFARLFWPGYKASLNDQPIEVIAHRGFLVTIDLPSKATGHLKLWFRPPGLDLGLGLTGLGLMILLVYFIARSHLPCKH